MNINLTLVIQIIHFLIAYVILNKLILRPGVQVIMQGQEYKNGLEQAITQAQNARDAKIKEKDEYWQTIVAWFAQESPQIQPLAAKVTTPLHAAPQEPTPPAILTAYTLELETYLIKRLEHVKS